jgi:hypothetical protein
MGGEKINGGVKGSKSRFMSNSTLDDNASRFSLDDGGLKSRDDRLRNSPTVQQT